MNRMGETNGDRIEQLEQRAREVRSRLEQRLDLLDARRQRMVDLARAATRPPASIALMAAVGATAAAIIVYKVRQRQRPAARLQRAFAPLVQRAPLPESDGMIMRAVKRSVVSVITLAIQRLGKQGLDRLLAEPEAAPPMAPAPAPARPRGSNEV